MLVNSRHVLGLLDLVHYSTSETALGERYMADLFWMQTQPQLWAALRSRD